MGWKTYLTVDIPDKCVICVAPHTSNWDFIIGKLYYSSIGGKPHFLMKKEWFFFPLGIFLKAMGGIPVNRKGSSSLTEQMIREFSIRKHFQLAIAPEGTRKKTSKWKTGFYFIALGAKVPISLAHIDYTLKEVDISRNFYPTGDERSDIKAIRDYYSNIRGKYPDNFSSI